MLNKAAGLLTSTVFPAGLQPSLIGQEVVPVTLHLQVQASNLEAGAHGEIHHALQGELQNLALPLGSQGPRLEEDHSKGQEKEAPPGGWGAGECRIPWE